MSIHLFFSTPNTAIIKSAVFLDRDGIINEKIPGGYVTDWAHFRFLPGIFEAIADLATLGLPIIVVSNQAAVEKRLLGWSVLDQITRQFVCTLHQRGARIDAVYYCPHTPEMNCHCRKPKPGLLEEAAQDWSLDLNSSVLVGDSPTDVQAAFAVGCKAILFAQNEVGQSVDPKHTLVVGSTSEIFPAVCGLLRDR